jgi:hypothetical protein
MSSKANDLREISELKEQLAFYKSARERERYWEGRWRDEAASNQKAADIIQEWQSLSDKQKEVVAELDAQLTECRRAHNSTLALFVAERERAEKAEAAGKRADLLAGSIEMGLGSDHSTIKRMCHFYRTGIDLPCGQFEWPTRAALQTKEESAGE